MEKREKRKKRSPSASTVLAESVGIQLERGKGGGIKKGSWSMSWQWAGHKGGACSSFSLAIMFGTGLPSGGNLSLRSRNLL